MTVERGLAAFATNARATPAWPLVAATTPPISWWDVVFFDLATRALALARALRGRHGRLAKRTTRFLVPADHGKSWNSHLNS